VISIFLVVKYSLRGFQFQKARGQSGEVHGDDDAHCWLSARCSIPIVRSKLELRVGRFTSDDVDLGDDQVIRPSKSPSHKIKTRSVPSVTSTSPHEPPKEKDPLEEVAGH
jgi:hypothetical protein